MVTTVSSVVSSCGVMIISSVLLVSVGWLKYFLKNNSMQITPEVIAESATLKTGLKKIKGSPPQIGTQEGMMPSINGK